ncbi:MAG: hypothetical protein WBR10_13180 [Candidatus Acidiferrum sp.]
MFKAWQAFRTALLAFSLATPAWAYDVPLTENSIRDAYFLGSSEGGLKSDFLATYARWIPDLKQGNCTSQARIETPFLQVANYSAKVPNYSAQNAVKEFFGKPLSFRIYLDVCYRVHAPASAIRVKIIQNKKELLSDSFENSPYSEPTDSGFLPPNGEQIVMKFAAGKIDSSDLTIFIDATDGHHATVEFDLQPLR